MFGKAKSRNPIHIERQSPSCVGLTLNLMKRWIKHHKPLWKKEDTIYQLHLDPSYHKQLHENKILHPKFQEKGVGSGVSFVTEANKQAQQQIKLVMLVCLSTCYCAKWICLYRLYKTNGIEKPYKYHICGIWQQHLIRWGTGFSRFILTKARWHLCSRPTWIIIIFYGIKKGSTSIKSTCRVKTFKWKLM